MPNYNRIKRSAKRNRLKIFLLLCFFIFLIIFLRRNNDAGLLSSQYQAETIQTNQNPTPNPNINTQKLLETEINKFPGTYNVYIKNLNTGQNYSLRADEKIPGASIYKLTVMYKTYDALENGEIKKDQILKPDLTVEKALELMITISDNESALLLAEELGWANIDNYLKDNGIDGFNLMVKDYPTTTAKATAELLEKIYKKEAVSKKASEEMMNLLLKQTKNDRIPLNLPKNIEVAHKTGELDNFRHDAGIIFGLKSDYIFVFLTETPIPENSYVNIAQLSKKLFEALEED